MEGGGEERPRRSYGRRGGSYEEEVEGEEDIVEEAEVEAEAMAVEEGEAVMEGVADTAAARAAGEASSATGARSL